MITNKNKKFLSKFGDVESREHLAATNGTHEIHLYDSPQQPTETMIKHSLNSPNWNAQMGAINSGMLTHEQALRMLPHEPMKILEKYPIESHHLLDFATKHQRYVRHAVMNAVHQNRSHEDRISTFSKILDLSSHNPNILVHAAGISNDVPPETHEKFVDHILSTNPAAKNFASGKLISNQSVAKSSSLSSEHVEKILDALPENEYPNLHLSAARYARLTDSRIEKNLQNPHLANRMKDNMSLTDEQAKKVPNHIFTELEMFK